MSTVEDQIGYYRRRAAVYDQWWYPQGDHAVDSRTDTLWAQDTDEIEAWVSTVGLTGNVLELAAGTGLFTRLLVRQADSVRAVDSSPEVLELNRQRLPDAAVSYQVGNIFELLPTPRRYDGIAFTYWHSHVPDDRLDEFWDGVAASLAPDGSVLLVDSAPWPPGDAALLERRAETRTLPDGTEHLIAKRYWSPSDLSAMLTDRGWDAKVSTTENGMILRALVSRKSDNSSSAQGRGSAFGDRCHGVDPVHGVRDVPTR